MPSAGGDRPTHPDRGSGSGYSIAQQIAAAHGGSIAVTSSASDGTIFRVRLPRDAAAAEPDCR